MDMCNGPYYTHSGGESPSLLVSPNSADEDGDDSEFGSTIMTTKAAGAAMPRLLAKVPNAMSLSQAGPKWARSGSPIVSSPIAESGRNSEPTTMPTVSRSSPLLDEYIRSFTCRTSETAGAQDYLNCLTALYDKALTVFFNLQCDCKYIYLFTILP